MKKIWQKTPIALILAFIVFFGAITFMTAGAVRFLNMHLSDAALMESHEAFISGLLEEIDIPNPNRPIEVNYSYDINVGYTDANNEEKMILVREAVLIRDNALYPERHKPEVGDDITFNIYSGALGIDFYEVLWEIQ